MVSLRALAALALALLPCLGQGQALTVAPGAATELALPAAAIGNPLYLLRVRARLDLPAGCEAWGDHLLGLEWSGGVLPETVNTRGEVIDLCQMPLVRTPLRSAASGRWFVRADSDYVAFNASAPGAPYQRESFLGEANTGSDVSGFRQAYYDKVFRLPPPAQTGHLRLHNHSATYPLQVELKVWQGDRDDCLFFVTQPGRLVAPTTFPDLEELEAPRRWRACPGERQVLQLGGRSLGAAHTFAWKLEPWRQANGTTLPEGCFDLRIQTGRLANEGKIPLEYRHYLQAATMGVWQSDRLVAASEWSLPAGKSSLLWIIATLPVMTTPGLYRSALRLGPAITLPLELEVLPFKLSASPRIYGLWTNSLPGRDAEARQRQCRDLRDHGIDTFFLDPWTVPVPLAADGTPDLRRWHEALEWLQAEQLNCKVLIYGILGPLLQAMEKQAGAAEPGNLAWSRLAAGIFLPMQQAAEKAGFTFYLHPYDEPDVHPKITDAFVRLCQALRAVPGLKIVSNVSASGQKHFASLIDLNICNSGYAALASPIPFANPFFPQWEAPEPEWTREHIRHVYTQVRASAGHQARLLYGLAADAADLHGVWGFAYHWNAHDWNIAWPFPEEDGRCGTTFGWEMLSLGIHDSRYLLTLRERRPHLQLPPPSAMLRISAEELASWRQELESALLDSAYEPRLTVANPPRPAYAPSVQAGPTLVTGELEAVPVAGYRVYTGNLYKHYWNTLDRDWTGAASPWERQGWLCDATPVPPTAGNVCYSFWRCQPGESYISVVLELSETTDVAAVSVDGSRLSGMYGVSHAQLSGSPDGWVFAPPGMAVVPAPQGAGPSWQLTLPGCGPSRFLLVSVWTDPNKYLNLRKIKVFRKAAGRIGE